jgi:ribosome maturation factor RimP
MQSDQAITKVRELVTKVAEQESCVLYDLEFVGRVLRIFIDKEGGAGIEDCSNVSKGLAALLDVDDPIPGGAYQLEVSTPGLDRSLKLPWHFEKVQGKKIWIRTSQALSTLGVQNSKVKSTKQLSETLVSSDATGVHFLIEEENVFVPYSAIEKAKLVFEMDEGPKGKPQNNKKKKN